MIYHNSYSFPRDKRENHEIPPNCGGALFFFDKKKNALIRYSPLKNPSFYKQKTKKKQKKKKKKQKKKKKIMKVIKGALLFSIKIIITVFIENMLK